MHDILMTILGIFLAVIILFIYPMMNIAGKSDELSQTAVQVIISDFVEEIAQKRRNNIRGL